MAPDPITDDQLGTLAALINDAADQLAERYTMTEGLASWRALPSERMAVHHRTVVAVRRVEEYIDELYVTLITPVIDERDPGPDHESDDQEGQPS